MLANASIQNTLTLQGFRRFVASPRLDPRFRGDDTLAWSVVTRGRGGASGLPLAVEETRGRFGLLAHQAGKPRRRDFVRRDPDQIARRLQEIRLGGEQYEAQREMLEHVFEKIAKEAPLRRERRLLRPHRCAVAWRPSSAGELHRGAEKSMRRPAPRQEGAVGAPRVERRADA